jgi:hypothetical protein
MYNLLVCRRIKPSLSAILALLPTVCLFAPGTASALDFNVQPRLTGGLMYYEFEQDAVFSFNESSLFGPLGSRALSDVMPFVGGGATFFSNKFFLDVYAQGAFSGQDESIQQSGDLINQTLTEVQSDSDWDRQEYAASVGYAVTDNFALFAGYRVSDTEFDLVNSVTRIQLPGNVASPVPSFTQTLDYEQDGPFLGGSYSWRYGDTGSLRLNLGIAFVSGDLQASPQAGTGRVEGDTVGTTLGLAWTAPLPVLESLNYTVGVDGYQFSFEGDDTEGIDVADFSETIVRASAGVSYLF